MLSEGHKMNIVYFDPYANKFLEEYIRDYSKLVESKGEEPITITKLETVDEVLQAADVRHQTSSNAHLQCCSNQACSSPCKLLIRHVHLLDVLLLICYHEKVVCKRNI